MQEIQSSFPRLKDTFVYEENVECRIVMKMMVLLFNIRAQTVGINQIRNFFMSRLNVDANIEMERM